MLKALGIIIIPGSLNFLGTTTLPGSLFWAPSAYLTQWPSLPSQVAHLYSWFLLANTCKHKGHCFVLSLTKIATFKLKQISDLEIPNTYNHVSSLCSQGSVENTIMFAQLDQKRIARVFRYFTGNFWKCSSCRNTAI